MGKAFVLTAPLGILPPFPDHRKVEIRDIREEGRGIGDRHSKGHPFRHDAGRVGEFGGHQANHLATSIEDGSSAVTGVDCRIHLEDPLDALRPHCRNPTSGHGHFPEAERKSDGDDFLIESNGTSIADRRFRQSHCFNLEQGEVVFRVSTDEDRRCAEFPCGHDEDPFRVGDHVVRRQDIPVAMDNDPAPRRFRGWCLQSLGSPEAAGACDDHHPQE